MTIAQLQRIKDMQAAIESLQSITLDLMRRLAELERARTLRLPKAEGK